MLKNGARRVYAIDVGYGQLDASLRNDPRVVNREKVNARYLSAADFAEPLDFVSIDVSFISLKLILPAVRTFLAGELVALIKPQFEVGKRDVGKGGIVRDEEKRRAAVDSVVSFARELGFDVKGVIESPIKGAEGNVEYLMWARGRSPRRPEARLNRLRTAESRDSVTLSRRERASSRDRSERRNVGEGSASLH